MRSLFGETRKTSAGRFHRDPYVFPDLICISQRSVYRDRTTIRTSFFSPRKGVNLALDQAPYEIQVTFMELAPYLPTTEFEFLATNGYLMIAALRT